MSNKQRPYNGNARFLELGTEGAPFRSLVNVDHISNVRFEQKIRNVEATYDDDGKMTAPPQQFHEGWNIIIVIAHGAGGQNIVFGDEEQAVGCYNSILDMIAGVGAPLARMSKLKLTPVPSSIVGANGQAFDAPLTDEEISEVKEALEAENDELPGEVPELTDEEVDALENPAIYDDELDALDAEDDVVENSKPQ